MIFLLKNIDISLENAVYIFLPWIIISLFMSHCEIVKIKICKKVLLEKCSPCASYSMQMKGNDFELNFRSLCNFFLLILFFFIHTFERYERKLLQTGERTTVFSNIRTVLEYMRARRQPKKR